MYKRKINIMYGKEKCNQNKEQQFKQNFTELALKVTIMHQLIEYSLSVCKKLSSRLLLKGIVVSGSNYYNIHYDSLYELMVQLVQNALQDINKIQERQQSSLKNTTNLTSSSSIPSSQHFQITQQLSIHLLEAKMRKLSLQRSVNMHEEYKGEKQMFFRMVQSLSMESPTQENVRYLLKRLKMLKQQIVKKEQKIQLINKSIESLQQKQKKHQDYSLHIASQMSNMQQFLNEQPNKILRQQALGFKEQEQELFDLAQLLEQQAPLKLDQFIQQSILVPKSSFNLTISSFPYQTIQKNSNYVIPYQQMEAFKTRLSNVFASTVQNLSNIIKKRVEKIKKFVEAMRKLASYTIGKRQYLAEINKKMVVLSVEIESKFEEYCQISVKEYVGSEMMNKMEIFKQFCKKMKNIYYQAQVFY